MKALKAALQTGLILLVLGFLPESSPGQIYLTGLLQDGTAPNGDTAGSPIWNTLGNELSFANLYITQPNAGYAAPFLNSGNGAGTGISYALTPGSYQFYFFCSAFPNNNPGYYGLSLFFDGNNNASPGIAAYSAVGVSSANVVPAGFGTLPLSGNTNNPAPGTYIYTTTPVPAPGTLAYTADGLTVTLTAYGFGMAGSFGVPALDRVSNLNDSPDGQPDGIGVVSLTVTPVPEPSSAAIFVAALSCFLISKVKPAHGRRKMKLSQIVLFLSAATFLAGCAGEPCPHYNRLQVASFYGSGPPPTKKPYGTVIPFDTPSDVKRPYRAIGFMSCEGNVGDEGSILKAMLYRAADMGADGIILNASKISQENIAPNNQKLNVNVTTGLIGEMIGNGNKRAFRAQAIQYTDTN